MPAAKTPGGRLEKRPGSGRVFFWNIDPGRNLIVSALILAAFLETLPGGGLIEFAKRV